MWGEELAKVLTALTALLWPVIFIYVFWLLRRILPDLISRVSRFEALGVKLRLSGEQAMEAALELAQKHPDWQVEVSVADRRRALDRANAHRALFDGAEILWVDDLPSNNRNEARMLRSFGAMITFAASTDEALRALTTSTEQLRPYHVILSDISRALPQPEPRAGIAMLARLKEAGFAQPVIFYVGHFDPNAGVPAGAFGIAHRPDILLQLVIDALSRVRTVV